MGTEPQPGIAPELTDELELDALSELFDAEFDMVYRFCLARTGSPQAAEDAAAETFADAARLVARGQADAVDVQWLRRVARNRVIDQWRADERHRRRMLRLVRSNREQGEPQPTFEEERVLVALKAVPSRQRLALSLRYLDGYAVDEVAEALAVTYQAAESLLARARRSFVRAYGETS